MGNASISPKVNLYVYSLLRSRNRNFTSGQEDSLVITNLSLLKIYRFPFYYLEIPL